MMGFSPDGQHLLSIGNDHNHSLAIYHWRNNILLISANIDHTNVL